MNPETMNPAVPAAVGNDVLPLTVPPEMVPDLNKLVIEDGKPVDSQFCEKQMRLLTEPLYSSWGGPRPGRTWQVFANVGLFYAYEEPPLVPDVMLAVDIRVGGSMEERRNRSYFAWDRGKPPHVAIEIVSDLRGREEFFKRDTYARIGVPYYAIFDPQDRLHHGVFRCFINHGSQYEPLTDAWFADIGLGLLLWQGSYEDAPETTWLRWCGPGRRPIATGRELAEMTREQADEFHRQADEFHRQADEFHRQADQERQVRERLEAKLRELGIDPKGV